MNAFVIALYMGYALYEVFPFKESLLSTGGTDAMRTIIAIIIYGVAVGISHYLLRRLGLHGHGRTGLPMIVLGFLAAGFILALCYQIFALPHLVVLPPIFVSLFAPSGYFFWWFIAPMIALFFLA